MKILVTGTAGFIGSSLAIKLLERGDEVIGLDNVNDYYDVNLKEARLERVKAFDRFTEIRASLEDRTTVEHVFKEHQPERVVHLAAQAGVRYSLENPHAYIDANIVGTLNILEGCRHNRVENLVYASSSSVYGANTNMPFSIHNNVDHPLSLYAATKKSNELMAHTYSHLYQIPTTGLRFFTVYGPWGRPDMALYLFTDAIVKGKPIKVFNNGEMQRDFTYVDDIVEGVIRIIEQPVNFRKTGDTKYKIYNIGNSTSVKLLDFIEALESTLHIKAEKQFLPMQPGDVKKTWADVSDLKTDYDYQPNTSILEGVKRFVSWYSNYNDIEIKS